MSKSNNSGMGILQGAFFILLAAMLAATLYPFNFLPKNDIEWLQDGLGLYFNGQGMAYTNTCKATYGTNGVSVELWLRERLGSKNWGPREIFSFYDGSASPSLLLGEWGGHLFVYSRFEKNEGDDWYRLFSTKDRFTRARPQLVTVTFGGGEKAIYINGELNDKKRVEIRDKASLKFSGRLILGNSPAGKNGWWGEIKGLAIFNRILLPDEIMRHSSEVLRKGMHGLAETPGCVAVYPFSEGKGNTAENIADKSCHFLIPSIRHALFSVIFDPPNKNRLDRSRLVSDFLVNIVFFVPFGVLLSMIIFRRYSIGYLVTFLIVTLSGFLLSLSIEFMQCLLPTRSPGITDVLSNGIGSGLGMLATFGKGWGR